MTQTEKETSLLRRFTGKLFGGLTMSWPKVILFAVCTAVLTAVFLIVPVFSNTSFHYMGETPEAWILFAIIIIVNCKKPLEAALKTFVFFLISQPLIYLLQVPFSELGFGLFRYYRYWFILTVLTFPGAFIAWFIKKKNWISWIILMPVVIFLTSYYISCFRFTFAHFPYQLIRALFCLIQVLLYLYAFTSNLVQKILGFAAPVAVMAVLLLARPQVSLNATMFLPDDPVLTENAVITVENADLAALSIEETGADSMIRIQGSKYGTTSFVIQDGDKEYHYDLVIYEDDQGHSQIRIDPQ